MPNKAIIVRVAGNTACPPGFEEATAARATRRTKLCVKMVEAPEVEMASVVAALPAPAPAPSVDPAVDDLQGLLAGMTMNQPFAVDVDQLTALMGGMGMTGGHRRRHTRRGRKAGRKSRKAGRRGASRRQH